MSLRETLRETLRARNRELNLRGKTLAKCPAGCNHGESSPGYSDSDSHGSYWVSPVLCLACGGRGSVEVPCTPEVEAAAIREEINRLKARLKTLKQPLARRGRGKAVRS